MVSRLPALLARQERIRRMPFGAVVARTLDILWRRNTQPLRVRLHGAPALLNPGNNYPFLALRHRHFNCPLVELVHQAARAKGGPIGLADIGAATGDSVYLLKQRCPRDLGAVLCIEGDAEFFDFLTANMRQFPGVTCLQALLARQSTLIPSLVKHHRGSALARGPDLTSAQPLDALPAVTAACFDVLKIDVDGSDGEVLAGASETLRRCRPAVIFEWHPKLIKQTQNEYFRGFTTLLGCGYDRFLWFDNTGHFRHFTRGAATESCLEPLKDYLLAVNARADEHFDVIALHVTSPVDPLALAMMDFARSRAMMPVCV